MSDPDRKSDAAVFLVGLEIDGMGFAEFCRLHLLDFVAEQAPRRDTPVTTGRENDSSRLRWPPFFTFLLKSPVDSQAEGLREFEMLFGHWPRIFMRREDVRDALHDTIFNDLDRQQGISIVILAKQPSDLLAHIDGLIGKLHEVFAARPDRYTRFWIIGVLLSGPNVDEMALATLLKGSVPKLQTIFLLGPDFGSTDPSLNESDFDNLRFVVDLARDGGEARRALRQLGRSQRGALLWLDELDVRKFMRSGEILGHVKSNLGALKNGNNNQEHEDAFNRGIKNVKDKIFPDQIVPPDTITGDYGGGLLKDSNGYRASALQKIDSFRPEFEKSVIEFYRRQIVEISKFVAEEDTQRVKRLNEIRGQIEASFIPDGGYSNRSQGVIRECIESFGEDFRQLEKANKRNRAKFEKSGRMLSKFANLPADSDLIDSDSVEFRNYAASMQGARMAASHLPYNGWTFFGVATLPVSSFLFATVSHAIAQGDSRDWALVAMDYFYLHGESVAIYAILSALLLPIGIALAYLFSYRKEQKTAFKQIRESADSIVKVVRSAMNETRSYARYARAALLSREAARILDRRLATDDKTEVANQAEAFLQNVDLSSIEDEDATELWGMAGHRPEREWFRWLVADRLRKGGAKEWQLEIGSGEAVTGVDIDQSALREARITIASAWLSSSVSILAQPLQPKGENKALDDTEPSTSPEA